ncbi:MAG: sigma-54 dependent transcriptional regulator [Acidobacteriia bacterium]|nr:sigma-54 dependent transcriptional regulator [Terriglobia bacterium]
MSIAKQKQALLVDDEDPIRQLLTEIFASEFPEIQTSTAVNGREAIEKLRQNAYDILVTDLKMPEVDGLQVLEEALTLYPDIIAIAITGYGTIETAVRAIKLGAFDYLQKPFEVTALQLILKRAIEQKELREENLALRSQLRERYSFSNIIGLSDPMRKIFDVISMIGPTPSTVLITGETGTGKELIARAIHYNSARRDQKLVSINCGAIPENLLETELFGHVRGAFTGAHQNRIGKFEQAHRGSIFLDEIGTMSPMLQVKLLRVLQEREFERVGDNHTLKVDVRVIAATSADLASLVHEGAFREDLFYRLNVIPIAVPALRERRDDIPLLSQYFLKKFCDPTKELKVITQDAMRMLQNYSWPGNVRQLENSIERAVAMAGSRTQLHIEDLPLEVQQAPLQAASPLPGLPEAGLSLDDLVADTERRMISESLHLHHGNKQKAADFLRLNRTTLLQKMKRLGIESPAALPPAPAKKL